jgi:hypothetical protein
MGFGGYVVFLPPPNGYLPLKMKRVLVVATTPVDQEALQSRLREKTGEGAEIKVVAPASDVSPLQWLATDEDKARGEAETVAREAAQAVEPEAERVEAEVGDSDPVQAIEDALRTFPAEEIVLVIRSDDEAGWLEKDADAEVSERFGIPLTRLVVD